MPPICAVKKVIEVNGTVSESKDANEWYDDVRTILSAAKRSRKPVNIQLMDKSSGEPEMTNVSIVVDGGFLLLDGFLDAKPPGQPDFSFAMEQAFIDFVRDYILKRMKLKLSDVQLRTFGI